MLFCVKSYVYMELTNFCLGFRQFNVAYGLWNQKYPKRVTKKLKQNWICSGETVTVNGVSAEGGRLHCNGNDLSKRLV